MRVDSNSLVPIHSEQEVFNYPVAPGNSVSFKNENEPYLYVKTMGFSQFDRPEIVKYKLIKEDIGNSNTEPIENTPSQIKGLSEDDLKPILDDIQQVKKDIAIIKKRLDAINIKETESKAKESK